MGILRILLAIAVVIAHSEFFFGFKFTGGNVAVQAFYIISGFYMSLVLNEKYAFVQKSYFLFISNRFLRLFPIYWIVLILTVLVSLIVGVVLGDYFRLTHYAAHMNELNPISSIYIVFSNILIFGQDWGLFMGVDPAGGFEFVKNFREAESPLYLYFLIPQAWTIGLELTFYLIAPFLVKRKIAVLLIMLSASLSFRLIMYYNGFHHDPWTHRFFPFELAFFLLGALSYKILVWLRKQKLNPLLLPLNFGICMLFTIFFQFFPESELTNVIYFIVIFLTLPFIFLYTKDNKWDAYIGEYSYVIYISHILVIFIVKKLLVKIHLPYSALSEVAIPLCFILSFVLIKFVSDKVENLRKQRVQNQMKTSNR